MLPDIAKHITFSTVFEGEILDAEGLKHKAHQFSEQNFKPLPSGGSGTAAFVDGGNAELLKAPNFSLQLCRVAYVLFKDNVRIRQERKEFYVLVTTENGKFVAKTFGEDLGFTFDMDDAHFKSGMSRGTPGSVVSAIRRFAELKLASSVDADIVVLDGSLQLSYPFEKDFFSDLDGKNVVGFCKTSSMLTRSGNSAIALMNMHKGAFVYRPVLELSDDSYSANVCFARLHEKAKHVFKIDFLHSVDDGALASLAANACDPVFLGYPYGLVLADRLARVSNEEAAYARTRLLSVIHDDDIMRYLNALNAHDVLDRI